ncbi:MAG: type II toxin-antitoxin system RelE/ParE family toxin [Hyphomonadaceae bacterium]|nr:type II toxin-antitoxin system RelE/ParE family toxin [Hyphomonadaceae bacterium]
MKQLIWTSTARADLDSIAEYHWQIQSGVGDMIVARIEDAAEKLTRFDTGPPGRDT